MKLELAKETNKKLETFYWIYIDGTPTFCYTGTQEAQAKKDFQTIKENGGLPENRREIIEVFETQN